MSNVTTFGAFTTARLGITAAQNALSVTGQNVTNINTKGYTRQRLDQISFNAGSTNRYSSAYNLNIGSGVLCTGISQIRDPYLDIRFRNEQSSVGAADGKLAVLEELTRILDEVAKGDGESGVLEAQFNDLMTQLEGLSDKVGQAEFDTLVRSSASILASLLNSYAKQLEDVRLTQEGYLKADVDDVNSILERIRSLNDSIMKSELHGDNALELRDQRNLLVDELSQYMKITVEYQAVSVGAGETVDKMIIRLAGTTEGSKDSKATLVDGSSATQLSIVGDNYNITLAQLKNAKGLVLDGSTVVELKDNDLYGSIQSLREMLTEAGEFTHTDVLDPANALIYDANAATKRGIPYYQKTLDSLAQQLTDMFNTANTGYLKNDKGNYIDGSGAEITAADLDTRGVPMGGALFSNNSNSNDTAGITAANIAISKDWSTGAVRIVGSMKTGADGTIGSTDNSNVMHMLALFDSDLKYFSGVDTAGGENNPYFTGSFQEMLANITATLANDTKTTTSLLNNYVASATEIDVSRQSISGVDLNDEAANLMQYQKAYAAACRLMTTLDEALDKLINGTGVVGR